MNIFLLPIFLIISGGLASSKVGSISSSPSLKKGGASQKRTVTAVPQVESNDSTTLIGEANAIFIQWETIVNSKKKFDKQEKSLKLASSCLSLAKAASIFANGRGKIPARHLELIEALWSVGDIAKEALREGALDANLLGCKVLLAKKILLFEVVLTSEELTSYPASIDRSSEEKFVVSLLKNFVTNAPNATVEQSFLNNYFSKFVDFLKARKNNRLEEEEALAKRMEEEKRLEEALNLKRLQEEALNLERMEEEKRLEKRLGEALNLKRLQEEEKRRVLSEKKNQERSIKEFREEEARVQRHLKIQEAVQLEKNRILLAEAERLASVVILETEAEAKKSAAPYLSSSSATAVSNSLRFIEDEINDLCLAKVPQDASSIIEDDDFEEFSEEEDETKNDDNEFVLIGDATAIGDVPISDDGANIIQNDATDQGNSAVVDSATIENPIPISNTPVVAVEGSACIIS